jgi:hypothetical protein
MLYLCPQRGCSGTFNLNFENRNTVITCNKCGAVLRFDGDTLEVVRGNSAPPPSDSPSTPRSETSSLSRLGNHDTPGGLIATVLFGLGAVTVIVFLFMPLIDHAQIVRAKAPIDLGERRLNRKERHFSGDPLERMLERKADPEENRHKVEREAWDKQRREMEEQVDQEVAANQRAQPLYVLGMLAGSLMLAVGSIAFLSPRQSTTRRIVGAIVITVEVLLIFLIYMVRSTVVTPVN